MLEVAAELNAFGAITGNRFALIVTEVNTLHVATIK